MAIRTKNELLLQYADNISGDITAQALRDFVNSSTSLQVQVITTSPQFVADTSDLIGCGAGADIVNLPTIADYGDRIMTVVNDSGGDITLTPDGAETIEGNPDYVVRNNSLVLINKRTTSATDWNIGLDTGQRTGLVQVVFNRNNNLNAGTFLRLGDMVTSSTKGYGVISDGAITKIGIAQTSGNNGDIELLINGAVDSEYAVNGDSPVYSNLSVLVTEGDLLSVRNKAGGGQLMNVAVSIVIEINL